MPLYFPNLVNEVALREKVLSNRLFNTTPSGTSIETMDTYTIPAGQFASNGDVVRIVWLFQQTAANNCTVTIDCPTGVSLLADARNVVCDRTVIVEYTRVASNVLRRSLKYFYNTGTWYGPGILTNLTDATVAIENMAKLTNGTAATDCRLISRVVTYIPAVS